MMRASFLRLSPLPLLAAALIALAGFFVGDAPSTSAQASPLWEATFTPKQSTTPIPVLGCYPASEHGDITPAEPCEDQLTDSEFTIGGQTYSFRQIIWQQTSNNVQIVLSADPNAELREYDFCIGTTGFPIGRSSLIVHTTFETGWTADTPAPLSIAENCFQPIAESTLTLTTDQTGNRVTEGGTIVITGTLSEAVSAATSYKGVALSGNDLQVLKPALGGGVVGTRHIETGENTFELHAIPTDDNIPEANEHVTVRVSVDIGRNGSFSLEQEISITIIDDDSGGISITADNVTPTEGDTVTLTFSTKTRARLRETQSCGSI